MSEDLTAVDFEPLNKSLENLKQILKKKDVIVDKLVNKLDKQAAVICDIDEELVQTTRTKNKLIKENENLRAKVNQLEEEIEDLISHLR